MTSLLSKLLFFQTQKNPSKAHNNGDNIPELTYVELMQRAWQSQPEEFDYDLEVEGSLPPELKGTLFRNGPGLTHLFGTDLVHPIDGDGMVCSITFPGNGTAHFRSKFVKTKEYLLEQKEKKMLFKGMMGSFPPRSLRDRIKEWKEDVIEMKVPNLRFKNPSNTNVYYWGGKLLSCWENGLPYRLDPATLDTIQEDNLDGLLNDPDSFGAHFRIDATNDVLVAFSLKLNYRRNSDLYIYEFDNHFHLVQKKTISLEQYYYCHDFLLTENYYIFHHTPFLDMNPSNMVKVFTELTAPGKLLKHYRHLPSRMIVIPRDVDSKEPIRYFDTDPCHIYHHLNAWEEGDIIYLSTVCLDENITMEFAHKIWLSNAEEAPGYIYNYRINLAQHTITREKADECSCEFPSVHPFMNGKPFRFGYLMASDFPFHPIPYQEVVKFDRLGKDRQVWSAREQGGILGEPVFVPRKGYGLPTSAEEEDEGWVIVQVYYYQTHETQFVILDAKNIPSGPVARLKLRHHTPLQFHGTYNPMAH